MQMIHNIWLHLEIVFLPRNTKNLQIIAFTSGMESKIAWWEIYNEGKSNIYNDEIVASVLKIVFQILPIHKRLYCFSINIYQHKVLFDLASVIL